MIAACGCWAACDGVLVVGGRCELAKASPAARRAHFEALARKQLDLELESALIESIANSVERCQLRARLARSKEFA